MYTLILLFALFVPNHPHRADAGTQAPSIEGGGGTIRNKGTT